VIEPAFTAPSNVASFTFNAGNQSWTRKKMHRHRLIAGVASCLLGLAPLTAQALPLGGAAEIRASVQETSTVEKVARLRCWWRNGERHCSRRATRPRAFWFYGRPRPEELPTGSKAWWQAMDEEGRGGHGRTP
jgi:hypothetical protein